MPNGPGENTPLNEAVALLVLDIQGAFLPVIHESNTFLSRCAFAIEASRVFGIQTFFTEQVPEKLGRSHSHLIQLADNPEIFHKTAFSAFRAEGLEEYLKKHGIYHLLIIGLEIPVCVYQTVLQAIDHEIDVTLLSDCLGSRRPQDTPAVLSSLAQMGCNILPSEAVFYSLLGDTTHPDFKSYTELVKKYSKDIEMKDEPPRLSIPQRKNSQKTRGKERNKNDQQSSSKTSQTEALSPQSSQSRAKQNQGSRRKSDQGRT
ncbi:MAG: isochorismatase family protein, partial [Opitutaceae bacterium]|nr:isochorismatase family protein [Opitutaceae bacterium]